MTTEERNRQGGSAFPLMFDAGYWPGATLRDFFAAAALTGLLAFTRGGSEGCDQYDDWGEVAEDAYDVADAMLKARPAPQEDKAHGG